MNQQLSDLFKKKQDRIGPSQPVDWDDRRNKYLHAVKHLYGQIDTELAEPIEQQAVTLHRRPKELTESYIGTYSADDLILVIGDEQVRFSPRGRNVAGAAGRVDVIGERAEAVLILQSDSRWAFVEARQPTLCTMPYDGSTLADVLQLVMRV